MQRPSERRFICLSSHCRFLSLLLSHSSFILMLLFCRLFRLLSILFSGYLFILVHFSICPSFSLSDPPPMFFCTSLFENLFISPSSTPDLKIALSKIGRVRCSLEPEWVSVLTFVICLLLKPIHSLSTTFQSLWRQIFILMVISQNHQGLFCFFFNGEDQVATILIFWQVCVYNM